MSQKKKKLSEKNRLNSPLEDGYIGKLVGDNFELPHRRVMIGIPMTGVLRSEWVMARYGQVIPCNWSQSECIAWLHQYSPLGHLVADARNLCVSAFIREGFEWLFFIDHDVVLPPGTILRLNDRMLEGDIPVWSGLYFTKSKPAEPLVYRGRGNGYYNKWKIGDQVWVDGVPMGCTMIHRSILEVMWNESEEYSPQPGVVVRRVFETPAKARYDPEQQGWFASCGTEDLAWCTRVIKDKVLVRAGWSKLARKKYPFLIDTSLFCKHIDWNGVQYPVLGEERQFS